MRTLTSRCPASLKPSGDNAKVRSNWTTVQNSPAGPKIGSGGAYDDDMVKLNGRWFFRYRTIDRYIRPEA